MYKCSLKQNMPMKLNGKWRKYGDTWEQEERPTDDTYINCEKIEKTIEKTIVKKPKKIEMKKVTEETKITTKEDT